MFRVDLPVTDMVSLQNSLGLGEYPGRLEGSR